MSTATALAGTFNADPVHSSFGFAVKYQNVSLFRGTLADVAATLVDGKLEGTAQVESISIRTPEQFRAHVLSAEFFDVENHPTVTFVSTELELAEDGTAKATGDLTIRGVTKPVTATGTWAPPSADRSETPARTCSSRPSSTARSSASTGTCRSRAAATRWPTT